MTDHGGDGWDSSGLGAEPLTAADPRRIGRFWLLGRLGSGGMGRVYLGLADGEFAAVKQVHPHLAEDQDFLRRFGHELDNLGRLPSGVSADLLDSDSQAKPPWLATSYVPGITLHEALRLNGGPLSVPDVWLLLREAAAGLAAVHDVGIVHRDLKPSNVMLRQDGLTLIDFGVAQALEQSRLTQSGMAIGTPSYMSPEQASSKGDLTGASDVFALGCLLGYAATGEPPYGEAGGVQVLYRIVHESPDLGPIEAVDTELAALVADCLARDPEDRPSATELVRRAGAQLAGRAEAAPWPAGARELLAERAEAAGRIPDAAEISQTVALLPPRTGAEPEPRKRRMPRFLLIPLVVVASGGAIALTPYLLNIPHSTGAQGADGSTASAPASATGAATQGSRSPSTSASKPSSKPGSSASPGKTGGSSKSSGTSGSSGSTGRSTGSSGSSGSGGSSGSTRGSTTSGSTGSSSSSGSSSSGGSSGGSGTTASGTHRLKSTSDGECLVDNASHSSEAYTGACSGSDSEWTYTAVSSGQFELKNLSTGTCLDFSGYSLYSEMVTCGSDRHDLWTLGTSTSSGHSIENIVASSCLENESSGAPSTLGVCGTSSSLIWSND